MYRKLYTLVSLGLFVVIASAQDNTTVPVICAKCNCDVENKLIDCSQLKLLTLFSENDWIALNNSGPFVYETVTFAGNNINNLTRFPELPIKYLNLSRNVIAYIEPRAFYDLVNLTSLDLSHNRITSDILKPTIFEGRYNSGLYEPLLDLRVLRLSNNEIHTLDSDIFGHLSFLQELYINDNPMQKIDRNAEIALVKVSTLKILDMSGLELLKLPEDLFHSIQTLEYIDLSRNGFHHIPEALADLKNVKELILDEVPINDLDLWNKFPELPKLEKLSLSYISKMEIIGEGAFSGLSGLKQLRAVNNIHLKEIHPGAFSRPGQEDEKRKEWPPIEKLWLHRNNLSYLEADTFANWDNMQVIDLRENPWQCDCNNEWILEKLIPKIAKDNEDLLRNLKCFGPSPMSGKTLKELSAKKTHMRCPDKYGNHPERDGTILIGLLLGVCIGVPFTLVLVIFYKRGCFGLFGRRGPADYSRAYYQRAGVYDDTMHHI